MFMNILLIWVLHNERESSEHQSKKVLMQPMKEWRKCEDGLPGLSNAEGSWGDRIIRTPFNDSDGT